MKISRALPVAALLLASVLVFPKEEARAEVREEYRRTIENYVVPDVTLVNQDGKRVKLRTLLNSKRVAMVDFIFTTCTTICPILSAGFADFQEKIGPGAGNVQLVSISIDPEHDTPKKLKEYLKRYGAKPGWEFLTGSHEDIEKVVRAFDAYVPDKMSHLPLALMHSSDDKKWVRIYGLIGTSDLMAEFRKLMTR